MADVLRAPAPALDSERLPTLDLLRGFAVLGILLMNVSLFAMPYSASYNPYALGEPSSRDMVIWSMTHVVADQKFMTIFSLLFGAGVLLMTDRAQAGGSRPARLHYRRMAWLLVFGLGHAYLLWHGDILVLYAVCGMVVYAGRRLTPRTLVMVGIVLLAAGSAISIASGLTMDSWPAEQRAEWQRFWSPPPEDVAAETRAFRGGWLAQEPWRAGYSVEAQTEDTVFWGLWRAGGLMLVGMALLKWGILTGSRPRRFYAGLAACGLGIGLPVVTWGLARHNATGWNVRDSSFLVAQWNYWGSIAVALGYIGTWLTLWTSGMASRLTARLSAVGRMAFSCYIFETLISTLVFYGHGLGLFGQLDRLQQMLFTIGVWTVLLVMAPLWLARFRYGPLEWLWRSLTYGQVMSMRRDAPVAATV